MRVFLVTVALVVALVPAALRFSGWQFSSTPTAQDCAVYQSARRFLHEHGSDPYYRDWIENSAEEVRLLEARFPGSPEARSLPLEDATWSLLLQK